MPHQSVPLPAAVVGKLSSWDEYEQKEAIDESWSTVKVLPRSVKHAIEYGISYKVFRIVLKDVLFQATLA